MKAIIDIGGELNPQTDDLLVYEAETGSWKPCSKARFLKEVWSAIEELRGRVDTIQGNVANVASVMKENL